MKLTRMQFNPFGEMTYVLWHEDGKDAFVVDPGMMDRSENEYFADFIEKHQLNVTKVLLTHIHIDHVTAAGWVKEKYNASIEFGQKDEVLLTLMPQQIAMFGLRFDYKPFSADNYLADGDCITLNGEEIKVLATPGHSLGSLSFYAPESEKVLTGDAVFNMSIGRTDLPGGNYDQLIKSINEKIMTLPEGTVIYPGHGDCSTVKDEKMYNPFLK